MLNEAQQFDSNCYQACEFGDVTPAYADTQLASETACWSIPSPLVYLKETGLFQKNSALICHVLFIDDFLVRDSRTSLKSNRN